GAGVARGYLNRPELTAERFLADPFVSDPDARMYRTGDLGRWRPDGNIEYLGRNDFQVKVRGFRIELGEIEARLAACAGVREAVVLAREEVPGDKRLVAYVVPQQGHALGVPEMRQTLSQALPEYMVPSAFVMLETLPLTPNGKLDRAALPAPNQAAVASRAYEAPAGEMEQAIAALWQELLNLERVGRQDDFFELGGHSLLAIKLMHALRTRFGADLPIAAIFSASRLCDLAAVVETGCRTQAVLVPLQSAGEDRPLFCLHPVGGQVFFYRALARHLAPRIPVHGIQAQETNGSAHKFATIAEMAHAYAQAIRIAQPLGPYRLLGWSTGGVIAAAVAAQLIEEGEEIEYLVLVDSRSNVDDAGLDDDALLLKAALVELRGSGYSWKQGAQEHAMPGSSEVAALLQMTFSDAEPLLSQWLTPDLDAAAFSHFKAQVPVTHGHLRLLAGYRPSPVPAPVQTFWAMRQDAVAPIGSPMRAAEPWTSEGRSHYLETDHYGLMRDPHVQCIAAAIEDALGDGSKPQDRTYLHVAASTRAAAPEGV
ncbi:thioesterase domain-containing protein, partial [Xanthomonas sp. LMG 8992]|uniref:thioesterase domain-containing protein n=1 Tax=Xanthomonas sp. LMG 8992 TaxID=1591157 RepID=UPI00136B39B4